MPERRSYHRFPAKGDLILHPENDPTKILKGELIDVGFLGFAVNLEENIGAGMAVQFELITSLLRSPLIGTGKIINVKEIIENNVSRFRVGVRFMDIDKNIVNRLLNTIQYEINVQMTKKKKSY